MDEPLTTARFTRIAADRARVATTLLNACVQDELHWAALRPRYSALESERARIMPSLNRALDQYFGEREAASTA